MFADLVVERLRHANLETYAICHSFSKNISNELISILEHQILVTDDRAQIISNTIAVALTLALPRLLVFIKLLLLPVPRHFLGATKSPIRGLLN